MNRSNPFSLPLISLMAAPQRLTLDDLFSALLRPVTDRLDDIERRLEGGDFPPAGADPPESGQAAAPRPSSSYQPDLSHLESLLADLGKRVESRLAEILERLPHEAAEPEDASPLAGASWEAALLGEELSSQRQFDDVRRQLLEQTADGANEARELVAQIMLTRGASAETLPMRLKDLGEACYAWQPKTSPQPTPLETMLKDWLSGVIERTGLRNTIELVQVGDRYDPARHTAAERGVEVAVVRGWIVLRDSGKPLHKAQVSVR